MYFSKLNKMEIQTGDHWSKLLKAAAITMNSTHGQTPFKVMWARESRHQDLLSTINNLQCNTEEDFALEDAIMNEVIPPLDYIEKYQTYFLHHLTIPKNNLLVLMNLVLLHNNQQWIVSILSRSNRRCKMIRRLTKDGELSFIHSTMFS